MTLPTLVTIVGPGQAGKTTLWTNFHRKILENPDTYEIIEGALTKEQLEKAQIPGDIASSTVTRNRCSFRLKTSTVPKLYVLLSVPGQMFQKNTEQIVVADQSKFNFAINALRNSKIAILMFDLTPQRSISGDPVTTYKDQFLLFKLILETVSKDQEKRLAITCYNKYDMLPSSLIQDKNKENTFFSRLQENFKKLTAQNRFILVDRYFKTVADQKIAQEKGLVAYFNATYDLFDFLLTIQI